MPRYVCAVLSTDTPQTCVTWVESVSVIDQLAITKHQAAMLSYEICSVFALVIAFLLFNRFARRA